MKMSILVQARMNASRLPGKMMIPVGGKPILQHVVERLRLSSKIRNVVVLTSDEVSDDPIADWCRYHSVEFFRGPLEDVFARFAEAVEFYRLDGFVRISADSPLIDAQMIDQMSDIFNSGPYDLVTNVMPRTFPRGQSVEILRAKIFLAQADKISDPHDREHVTPYFYRHASEFRIKNVENSAGDYSAKNLCVDTHEDLDRLTQMVGVWAGSIGQRSWQECVAAADEVLQKVKAV